MHALGAALKNFCNKIAARLEDFDRGRERSFGERDNSQMVGCGMTGRRRSLDRWLDFRE